MLDVFKPMPARKRAELRGAYREFLRVRDGEPNYETRTLSRREERMDHFSRPLPAQRPLDRGLFEKQYVSYDPDRETPIEMMLLLGMVKLNAAESYGVNRAYTSTMNKLQKTGDELEMLLLLEETYHTKILLSASNLFGFEVSAPYSPSAALKALISGIVHTPEFLARPLTLAGEIIGMLGLVNLLNVTHKRLDHDPELRDAMEERIMDVLVDELGHISFNRMQMGELGLMQTRMLLPIVSLGLSTVAPEMSHLGVMPTDPLESVSLLHSRKQLPESVRRQAFIA